MKFVRLIWVNLWRNKPRTILTVLSVVVALFLFTTLRSVVTALDAVSEVGSEARLVTRSSTGITFALPRSYFERLQAQEGVRSVTWANWFGGNYVDESNFFPQFAVDQETYLAMYPEMAIPDDQREAFLGERKAALVGRGLMERFLFRGERNHACRWSDNLGYMMSFQVEPMSTNLYRQSHIELIKMAKKRGIFVPYPQWAKGNLAPFSLIDYEAHYNELHLHTFHAFPEQNTIIKTQSLFSMKK